MEQNQSMNWARSFLLTGRGSLGTRDVHSATAPENAEVELWLSKPMGSFAENAGVLIHRLLASHQTPSLGLPAVSGQGQGLQPVPRRSLAFELADRFGTPWIGGSG